jgi:predicted RNA methylase
MEKRDISIGGKSFRVISDDQYLAAMGADFEPHMVQLFRALINPNDVVTDIGANIRLTALLFSGLAHKVYAFEPSPSKHEILRSNLTANHLNNVEAVNFGLGEKVEALTITFEKNNYSGDFVSEKTYLGERYVTEEINIETLGNCFC